MAEAEDLFYEGLIAGYVEADGYVRRGWLEDAVLERLERPECRYVLLTAEPGAGKSGLMASLAHRHTSWLRYFIRRDSTTPLSDGDAASAFLRIGHQFATRYPALFDPQSLEVVVKQRIGEAGAGARVVGVRIEDLQTSPFYRTAIRVEQDIRELGGQLVGVEVAQATIEPRLLAPQILQHLALLDPAAALARSEPGAKMVVLLDALDEVMRFRGEMSVLDWLERGPEPPPNVRFVLSSRPTPRLRVLQGVREGQVEVLHLDPESDQVLRDTRAFTRRLLTEPEVAAASRMPDIDDATNRVAYAASGNFAYLRAYERALRGAIQDRNIALLDALLRVDALPSGLAALYSVFLRNIREEITQLGALEIERPLAVGDDLTPAWEGAGQRMLGVLAVARAPLTLDQIMRLGSIRVWPSAATSVLQRLAPFLDEVGAAWRLFHPSLAEFLTGEAVAVAPDLGITGAEWHRRVVRAYRGGAATWADVDWTAVDDYGLRHIAEHLVELGDEGCQETVGLVNARLRKESQRRYLTDLPFKRVVETALAEARHAQDPVEVLATTIFLAVVRAGVSHGGLSLAPAVLGLMARLGRAEEALARAELLAPGEHQFASFQAILACTQPEKRRLLGGHDGADRLASAALEIPATEGPIMMSRGYIRNKAIEAAAAVMGSRDLERALRVAAHTGLDSDSSAADAALATAAGIREPAEIPALIGRMRGGRAPVAVEAARRTGGHDREVLLDLAEQHVAEEPMPGRIRVLADLVVGWHPGQCAASAADRLRGTVLEKTEAESSTWGRLRAIVDAARTVRDVDHSLAGWLLDRVAEQAADATASWDLMQAARLWAEWGETAKCRELAERVLAHERSLGWYGPASSIAELAVIVDAIDPRWGQQLADEAMTLVQEATAAENDDFERSRIDNKLGEVARAFRTWDPQRALRAAFLMSGSWIRGGTWDSFHGRLTALACLGIDATDTDPELARQLLRECLPDRELDTSPGRRDPRLVRGGLFRPAQDVIAVQPSASRVANLVAYVSNSVNYWVSGRNWRTFSSPADVARSIRVWPGSPGGLPSWAGAIAAAVEPVAAQDLEAAIDLAGWPADPCERLIACAALVRALTAVGDARAGTAMDALGRTVMDLPRYVAELTLEPVPQGPALAYLSPEVRARWEASLLLPADAIPVADALAQSTGSWYLVSTLRAQRLWESLFAPVSAETSGQAVVEAVVRLLPEQHPDDIQLDLVRAAAVWALTPYDSELADAMVARITHDGIAVIARLFAAARTAADPAALTSACHRVLDAAPSELSALHRAAAAAMAATLVSSADTSGAQEMVDRGVTALQGAEPLEVTSGLALLAATPAGSRRAELVGTALTRADLVANRYLRIDALPDLLGPAILTCDASLMTSVVQRLLAADWQVLMEGLRRGMNMIVATLGPAVVPRLDRAMCAAQEVLADRDAESATHLDAVVAPRLRKNIIAITGTGFPVPPIDLDAAALYLQADDLPAHLELVQDSRDHGSDPGDYAFRSCGGIHSGSQVWMADMTHTIWRLVDIRFVFPDAKRAAAYHAERLLANSEENPPLADAPLVGDDCHVFGGTRSLPTGGLQITMYFYIFRIGKVVVKLFAAQGVQAPLIP